MIAFIALVIGLWCGTGWVWFKGEPNIHPRGLRFYRAITWLPCTVLPTWAWFWRSLDRRWYQ